MEAIRRTLGKPLVVGVDAPEFGGGGADEFLTGGRMASVQKLWRRKGESAQMFL